MARLFGGAHAVDLDEIFRGENKRKRSLQRVRYYRVRINRRDRDGLAMYSEDLGHISRGGDINKAR